ncbi:MAG: DUF721 domain-containing protein [Myxococcales bacterium]|nr:DUF721 domain-containing protein [Myxococcales bacterium]
MERLGSILDHTKEIAPPKHVPRSPIDVRLWELAVGTRIASRAQPLRLDRGTLLVIVSSAAWANELCMLGDAILEKLVDHGVKVDKLRFRVGEVRPHRPRRLGNPKVAPPPDATLPPGLKAVVATIADDDLQRALSDAAAKTLAVRRR